MKTCKYPDCFNCNYDDCIMTDKDLEIMQEYKEEKKPKEKGKQKKRTPICDRCKKCILVEKPNCDKTTRLCTRKLKLISDSIETTPYWCPRKDDANAKS